MSNLDRRLNALSRQLGGCSVHAGTIPWCPRCDLQPMPKVLEDAMRRFVEAVVGRKEGEIGQPAVRALAAQVPRPAPQEVCRCGTKCQCWRCMEAFTRGMLSALELTPDEERELDACMALARELDS